MSSPRLEEILMAQNLKRDQLILAAIQLLSKGETPPGELMRQLDPETAKLLMELTQQLKAQGMSGPTHRTPERLKVLIELLNRYLPPEREPSDLEFLSSLSPALRKQVMAQEALLEREAAARQVILTKQQLAKVQNSQAMTM